MQRLADDRVQAIARDERIGTRAGVPLARARVAKMGDDTGGILLEANAGTAGKHAVGAQPLDDGIVLQPVWSEWMWVRMTSSTSSGITPSAASSSGSAPPTPSHRPKAESVGPTPVSIKVRRVGMRTRKQ